MFKYVCPLTVFEQGVGKEGGEGGGGGGGWSLFL